jgi:hypothetical protein
MFKGGRLKVRQSFHHFHYAPNLRNVRIGGRNVVVDLESGKDIFGEGFNARSRVHEYGGGPAIVHGGLGHFTNASDLKVYKVDLQDGLPGTPESVSPGVYGIIFV